jgi:hypothetical protein
MADEFTGWAYREYPETRRLKGDIVLEIGKRSLAFRHRYVRGGRSSVRIIQ